MQLSREPQGATGIRDALGDSEGLGGGGGGGKTFRKACGLPYRLHRLPHRAWRRPRYPQPLVGHGAEVRLQGRAEMVFDLP